MSGRYGRYIVALGGLAVAVLLIAASPQQVKQAPQQKQASANPASAGQAQPEPPSVQPAPQAIAADRLAQPAKANEIEPGSWPDWVMVAFTGFLAWLSWRQHELEKRLAKEGRDTLKIAKQSADAATRSSEATERLASQLRPYVAVRAVAITNVAPAPPGKIVTEAALTDPMTGPTVGVEWVNLGPAPAMDVEVWFSVALQEYPLRRKLPRRVKDGGESRATLFTGVPSNKSVQYRRPLTLAEIDGLKDGTMAVWLRGFIKYRDAAGKDYVTRFRLYHNAYTGMVGVSSAMTYDGRGNKST